MQLNSSESVFIIIDVWAWKTLARDLSQQVAELEAEKQGNFHTESLQQKWRGHKYCTQVEEL